MATEHLRQAIESAHQRLITLIDHETDPGAATRELDAVGSMLAAGLDRFDGQLIPGVSFQAVGCDASPKPNAARAGAWDSLLVALAMRFPERLPGWLDIGGRVEHGADGTVDGSGVFKREPADWRRRAQDYRAAVELLEEHLPHTPSEPGEPGGDGRQQNDEQGFRMGGEERALAVLAKHPDWTDTQVAEAAGVNRGSLYRWKRYQQAKRAMKAHGESGRREMQGGRRTKSDRQE